MPWNVTRLNCDPVDKNVGVPVVFTLTNRLLPGGATQGLEP